jgi:hypothetical protein
LGLRSDSRPFLGAFLGAFLGDLIHDFDCGDNFILGRRGHGGYAGSCKAYNDGYGKCQETGFASWPRACFELLSGCISEHLTHLQR